MKIVYIAQTCPPEPGATKRPLEQAKVLVSLGHEVTLITAFPSYPHGRIYDQYRSGFSSVEMIDGVKILRVWSLVSANTGIVRRMLSFFSFAVAATIAGLRQGQIDVVVGSVPKPLTELAALITARIRRAVFVLELRDLMPDTLTNAGFSPESSGYRIFDTYYRWVYRRVDVFAVTYGWMTDILRARGAVKAPILLLPHAVDPVIIQTPGNRLRAQLKLTDRFVITYAGSFSPYYRIPLVAEAAELAAQSHPEIAFLLIGTGPDFSVVSETVKRKKLHNVILLGGIDPPLVAQYLHASDAFVHPQFLPEFMDGTKIIEYLSVGRPIVNICMHVESQGQAERFAVGYSVAPDNAAEMVKAVTYYSANAAAAEQAGNVARKLVKGRFERRTVVEKFAAELAQIVNTSK